MSLNLLATTPQAIAHGQGLDWDEHDSNCVLDARAIFIQVYLRLALFPLHRSHRTQLT